MLQQQKNLLSENLSLNELLNILYQHKAKLVYEI